MKARFLDGAQVSSLSSSPHAPAIRRDGTPDVCACWSDLERPGLCVFFVFFDRQTDERPAGFGHAVWRCGGTLCREVRREVPGSVWATGVRLLWIRRSRGHGASSFPFPARMADKEANTMVWFDKLDGKEYRVSFEHAKLLYLVSHYARSSKSDEQPETWVRELPLDVLMYEGICANKLDFDYAPVSKQYLYADDNGELKVKRCYLNISQEARSAIDDLIEQDFVKSLKVPNDDNMTTSAFQASLKGLELLQALPPILRLEVDDFLYIRQGYKDRVHPKKDLINVLTDDEGFLLVTENGSEIRSSVSQVEDVSYVTSPFLPWTYRSGETPCTDNSNRAWESGVGISQVKREMSEAIVLSQVNILIQEWIPTAANEFCSLLDRFGVRTRNAGGRFTPMVDRRPNDQILETKQGLTRVELLDYNSSQCVNFEGEIQFAEDEGVKQVEFIGIHLHTMGAISCGFRVEAIQNRLADDVSCDLMSRMMVDVVQDTSKMLNDLMTPNQRRAINTIYRGNALSRNKYCLIFEIRQILR